MPASLTTVEHTTVAAADGLPIAVSTFEPAGDAGGTVLIATGVAVPRRTARHLAGWLAERGLRAVTFDYRGVGDTALPRGRHRETGLTDWARDGAAVFRWIEGRWGTPAYFGHSFGGQALGVADDLGRARGIVLAAAQFGDWRDWRGLGRIKMVGLWYGLMPAVSAVFRTIPGWAGLGMAVPSGVTREWARWGRHAGYLTAVVDGATERLARVAGPVLAYTFVDDALAPQRAAEHLLATLTGASVTHLRITPGELGQSAIGHFGVFKEILAAPLWEEMHAFLREALAAPPP